MRHIQLEVLDVKSVERRALCEQFSKSFGNIANSLCNGCFPDLPNLPLDVDDLVLKMHLRKSIEKSKNSRSRKEFLTNVMKCRVLQRLLGSNFDEFSDPTLRIPENFMSPTEETVSRIKPCPICGSFVSNMDDHILTCISNMNQDFRPLSEQPDESIEPRKRKRSQRSDFCDDWDDEDFTDRIRILDEDIVSPPIRVFPNEPEEGLMDGSVFAKLHNYQREGIKWLFGLYLRRSGGILADDMGLGKTAQAAAHICMMSSNNSSNVCSLIICLPTVLEFWVRELHTWCPRSRIVVFHSISKKFSSIQKIDLSFQFNSLTSSSSLIVLTTYEGLVKYELILLTRSWTFVVLDEGHKIRNPKSNISIACRSIPSDHRVILTGTPIQNSLTELWSLMDFATPGRLGTLESFELNFVKPIRWAGLRSSSRQQTTIGIKSAQALKDLISPFFLRRLKECLDIGRSLPPKTEHVLYCKLSGIQRQLYLQALKSDVILRAMNSNCKPFQAISLLRHICNHSCLVLDKNGRHKWDIGNGNDGQDDDDDDVASSGIDGSGKMIVLNKLLSEWNGRHKVLLFSQTRMMLNIIEGLFVNRNWSYLRMDGNTPIPQRDSLVDQFNNDRNIFAFLLTTRTGGLGVSLTGADRVIILDPDWNPQVDVQARERAWRIGQEKPVSIYRLICKGTIEEKIYHRQIFKMLLTNRVLKDPRATSMFKYTSLRDFFQLDDDDEEGEDGLMMTSIDNNQNQSMNDDEDGDDGRTKSDQDVLLSLTNNSLLTGLGDHESLVSFNASDNAAVVRNEIQTAVNEIRRSYLEESSALSSLSSSSIISDIRMRNISTSTGDRSFHHLAMLKKLKTFLESSSRSTEEILTEFKAIPDSYAPYFRHAINCLADNVNGKWILKRCLLI